MTSGATTAPTRTATSAVPELTDTSTVMSTLLPLSGMAWLTVVLLVDADAGRWTQRLLGLLTWGVLIAVLRRETRLVRVQTGVVIAFATVVEYTFSPLLEVYIYRFDNVPAYVPPGHGLVYLAALALGRTAWVQERLRILSAAVVVAGGLYAAWGLWLAERPDVLGALWYCCLVGFLVWGPSRGLYVGAFVVVTYLEIMGTALGTWSWQPVDPTGLIAIGNPPSGAAGGYGWFDLAALLLAPRLVQARPPDHRAGPHETPRTRDGQSSRAAGRGRAGSRWTEPLTGAGSSGSSPAGSPPT